MKSYSQELINKIKKNRVNVSIFGVGYVGIKLVLALANKNCVVSCFDKDDKKLNKYHLEYLLFRIFLIKR